MGYNSVADIMGLSSLV